MPLRSILVALCLGGLACASGPREPDFVPGVVTADGLHQVRTMQVAGAYVKPGAELGSYTSIRLDPVTISYKRPPRERRSGARMNPSGDNWALTDSEKERVERLFQEAFERELSQSENFTLVEDDGPDVLRVSGHIVDLVVTAGPEPSGRDRSFVREAGQLTLVLDVRDSESGEALARIADRRSVSASGGFRLQRNSVVNNQAELRRIFSRWARFLRNGLDNLRQLPEIPQPDEG